MGLAAPLADVEALLRADVAATRVARVPSEADVLAAASATPAAVVTLKPVAANSINVDARIWPLRHSKSLLADCLADHLA
eukprot:1601303-Heterocapsa_arctica.AAC.1